MFGEKQNMNPKDLQNLAKSGEVKQLMALLQKNGGVQEAAKSASSGDPKQLLSMVQQLMSTQEGSSLIEQIQKKAKESGIE